MKLEWSSGEGPADTKELAALIRKEGRLGTLRAYNIETGLRCAFGVAEGATATGLRGVLLASTSKKLASHSFSVYTNDLFGGTPEERCEYMARIAEAIP